MYQHNGKQRYTEGNSGQDEMRSDQVKGSYQVRSNRSDAAHNPKVAGSNPAPATKCKTSSEAFPRNRAGPLTLSEVLGANEARTSVTFGVEPDEVGWLTVLAATGTWRAMPGRIALSSHCERRAVAVPGSRGR